MDPKLVVSFVATVIMVTFAAIVLNRYVQKRQLHNLFWGIGLLMFGIGTFAEAYLALAWSALVFRAWYVFGAMLNAGWLGHGSLTLLARRPWVRYLTAMLVVLSLIGITATSTVPLNSVTFDTSRAVSVQYKDILPKGGVRLFTPFFNIYGTLFLVGGAVYSAYLFWRKRMAPRRVVGNLLIAAGALVIASAGTLTRLFFGGSLGASELAAAILMFAGFMLASVPAHAAAPAPTKAAPTA